MAETLLEQKICAKCGAEVRNGALFCYHCGGAVEAEVAVSAANGDSVSSGWFRENIAVEETSEKSKDTTKLEKTAEIHDTPIAKPSAETGAKPIAKPTEKLFNKPTEKPLEVKTENPKEKTEKSGETEKPKEETKLTSAAAMRRKTKIVEKKRVEEVEWEEHENAPNLWFLLVALVLIAIAGGIFFLAVFVK